MIIEKKPLEMLIFPLFSLTVFAIFILLFKRDNILPIDYFIGLIAGWSSQYIINLWDVVETWWRIRNEKV